MCLFSVFTEHKESLGMRLCPRPIFIFAISLCLCTIHECEKWTEMIRMFILSFWDSSLTLKLFLMYHLLQWHTEHLNGLLGSISPLCIYILNPHLKQSIIVYYPHFHTNTASSNRRRALIQGLITSPTHFQCTGYLHIQMLIQMSLSGSPIIVFNSVVPCIRVIFIPMP